jgi:hypothetical protein
LPDRIRRRANERRGGPLLQEIFMNSSRRTPPGRRRGLPCRLRDAASIAVLMAAAVTGAVVAASESLQDVSGDAAIVVRAAAATAVRGDAPERSQ